MSTGMRKWMEKDCPEIEYPPAQVLIDREEFTQLRAELDKYKTERDALRAKIEAAENDAAHQKALADSALRVAEGWERKCGELRAALQHETDCVEAAKAEIDTLRAKITEMEQQEPVAWATKLALEYGASTLGFRVSSVNIWGEKGVPLYALPGAKGEEK